MGKNKEKDATPNPASVTNRDILQRLNFLYQASVLLNGLTPPGATPHNDEDNPSGSSMILKDTGTGNEEGYPPSRLNEPQRKKKKRRRVVGFEELSRSYVEMMKIVGQKTNVRMDPSVKRRICKRCSAPLVPGISATVRIQDSTSHGHLVVYRCHCCQTERRIPAPPVLREDPLSEGDAHMEEQSTEAPASSVPVASTATGNSARRKRKKGPQPRLPPHFARGVGHVVFRGNERLDAAHKVS